MDLHHCAHGEWDKVALRMIGELVISKHLAFKWSNIHHSGVLMRQKKG